jgi:hypothetical protein
MGYQQAMRKRSRCLKHQQFGLLGEKTSRQQMQRSEFVFVMAFQAA